LSPLTKANSKVEQIQSRVDKINKFIEIIQSINNNLEKFKNLLDSFQIPQVDRVFSSAINKISELKTTVDIIVKECRDVPNSIIESSKNNINMLISIFMVALIAFNA